MKNTLRIITYLLAFFAISCTDSIGPEVTKIDFTGYTAFKITAENFAFRNYHYIYGTTNQNWESYDNLSYYEILGDTINSVEKNSDTVRFVKYAKSWDTTRKEQLNIVVDTTNNSITYLQFDSYFGYSRIIGYHNSSTSGRSQFSLILNNLPYKIVNDTLIISLNGAVFNQYNIEMKFEYGTTTIINDFPTGSSHSSGDGYYSKELLPSFDISSIVLKLYRK